MSFYPFEVTTPHIIYAVLGGFIVLFGMFSLLLRERLYIGEAIWAFLFGVIVGPYCANIFNPRAWGGDSDEVTNAITLEFTRVVLAIGVFAIGVELPKAYMAKHWKSLFYLLVPVMTWGWFVSAGLIFALIPGLNFLSSLAIAACLTPTDPILAAAVVGGKWADKHVPAHIRHLLAAESGCNDGAAFPFLFIALYLIIDRDVGTAVKDWFLVLWLYQVILGCIIGCLLGFGFRHLMKFCQRHDLIDRHSYVAQYISLAILSIGLTTLLGSDDLLAAFFCGTAFAWDGFFNRQTEESVFSSVIDTLFNIAAFVFVGAWMPFNKFQDTLLTLEVWRLIVIAILVLLLRRLPVMVALYKWIPDIKTFREAVFCGHFGPIGIGAVFISTLAVETLRHAQQKVVDAGHEQNPDHLTQLEMVTETIQPIVAFMVLCSITIHGLSIPSFSLGRRVHSVSRTWSRRDTMNSQGGSRTPEWANQARLVRRGDDIVINRDADTGHRHGLMGDDVDLEKGELHHEHGSGSNASEETKFVPPSPTRLHTSAPAVLRAEDDDGQIVESPLDADDLERRLGTPTVSGTPIPQRPGPAPLSSSVTTSVSWAASTSNTPPHHQTQKGNQGKDYREEAPPDGTETLAEWQEGYHRVIERRMGPGSDVEVTVINEDPTASDAFAPHTKWSGKLHEWEKEVGEAGSDFRDAIRKEVGMLGRKARDAVSPVRSKSRERGEDKGEGTSSGLAGSERLPEQAVADDDDEEGWASEGSNHDGGVDGSGRKGTSPVGAKSRVTKVAAPHHVHAHKSRRRWSFKRSHSSSAPTSGEGTSEPGDIVDGPRGRDGRPSTPTPASVTFAGNGGSPGTRLAGHGHPGYYPRSSRPGTADTYMSRTSARSGDSGLRNHRVESIRALHSVPPTRESSPSRSVRFVDGGRRGSGGVVDTIGNNGDGSTTNGSGSPHGSAQVSRAPSPTPASPGAR